MTHHRTIRTAGPTGRVRSHVLRRDGIIEETSDIALGDRYRSAIAAGWRPLA
jgi:hypothetical protein